MFKRFMRKVISDVRKSESGFTLMELLVVIVILGFLIGMIAPRLAGIIDDQVIDNICDSNNKGARQYLALMYQKTGNLPNHVTTLVNETATGYVMPSVDDVDPENGAEAFAETFVNRNDLNLHILHANEAKELRDLGISKVRMLNYATAEFEADGVTAHAQTATNPDGTSKENEAKLVEAGLGVLIVGPGAADATASIAAFTPATSWNDASAGGYAAGNPYWLGRMVFGLGASSSLVTGGYVQNAALCPGGMQAEENVAFNNYCVVVPRLAATVKRYDATNQDATYSIAVWDDETGAISTTGKVESFELSAQESWEFDATCPEGHKWPDNDNEFWAFQ